MSLNQAVNWFVSFPARGITKPGRVVHRSTLANGLSLFPPVGDVRGIFVDVNGRYWVRVSFPWSFGRVSTHSVEEVTGHYPKAWDHHGDWGRLQQCKRKCQLARREAGLPELVGVWPDDYVPLPANFYRG